MGRAGDTLSNALTMDTFDFYARSALVLHRGGLILDPTSILEVAIRLVAAALLFNEAYPPTDGGPSSE